MANQSQPSSIDIVPDTLGHLLQNTCLQVPLSQRSYRWEREHVEELYKDINGAIFDRLDEYFIGSIVGIKSGGTTYIYDGQQRLATTMILIAAIRDYFYHHADTKTADLIENESLISVDRKTHKETPHFSLNAEDNAYFYDRVLLNPNQPSRKAAKPSRDSHKRINDAALLAADFVNKSITAGLAPNKAGENLHNWLDYIKNSLRVIWVQVGDERTAFTIFETMNDRGLRLSAADLLKNWLYAMGNARRNEVIQKWQSMAGILETIEGEAENIVEFVRCFWITKHGHTRTKVLYDEIKKEATNEFKAVALASDLESTVQDYAAILLSSHEKWASRGANVRTKIENIKSLGVTQVRPLLLSAFRNFTPKEFDKLLDACVSWSVRTLICGVPSGTIEGYYSRNALEISKGTLKKASEVKTRMASIIPNDATFELAAASARVSAQYLARYYLRAMQQCKDGIKEPQYIPNPGSEITLEHILPSKPGSYWNHLNVEEQKSYVNRLGNQVLLPATVNSKIGNVSYKDKKNALGDSNNYSLTKETAVHTNWGVKEIEARQKILASLAVKTWPI